MNTKAFITICALVVIGGAAALTLYIVTSNSSKTSGSVTSGVQLGNLHEIKVGNTSVEVGDAAKDIMPPQVKLARKDDNVSLSMSYPVSPEVVPQAKDNMITWKEKSHDIYFKDNKNKYEFDILLKVKPPTNVFTYNLKAYDLDFFEDKGGYAVFKKGVKPGDSKPGVYGKGEVFHIEQPKIVDAKGHETVGKLTIDQSKEELSVTVDKNWLAQATYPVVVDPTIFPNDTSHVIITKVDRFRWKLAVEYEIRDDNGKLLGSDVVIMEANPGETAEHIFGFFQRYLKQRAAVWLLAQGKYKLYEMSKDRLSSSHFQKEDSGDDIDDTHSESRQARKQILSGITQANFPSFSLTLQEAESLQIPDVDETIGKSKKPTGRKIKGSPTFEVRNEKIGAGAEILRPNASQSYYSSNESNYTFYGDYTDIDEAEANDTDYLYTSWSAYSHDGYVYVAYPVSDSALTTEPIDNVSSFGRFVSTGTAGGLTANYGLRLGADNQWAGALITPPGSWTDYGPTITTRPGGGSWSTTDLDSLNVLIRIYLYDDYDLLGTTRCSQAYIVVNYSDAGAGGIQINP